MVSELMAPFSSQLGDVRIIRWRESAWLGDVAGTYFTIAQRNSRPAVSSWLTRAKEMIMRPCASQRGKR
jgi:hypothetical protein